eukprot:TRINITY_DN6741_c0_g1_i3.p1 TRINITY_DN6741_c0_g1~~TRINITY_DN6741_c0_g1_i3.p1  ORF type:complete len:117 (+),score=25.84 TRINITY_DN6741_c0_g1_i3:1-351(+)
MIRRPPRSTPIKSSAASDVYKRQLKGYLGEDTKAWQQYDATELVSNYKGPNQHILIDQGGDDKFLATQLKPENFESAARKANIDYSLRMSPGYDHSYYFISTFIGDHIAHHVKYLQ